MLVLLPLAVIVLFLIKGAAGYGQAVLMKYVGLRITTDMRIRLFSHLMPADLPFYHNTASGELISRFTSDVLLVRKAGVTALTGLEIVIAILQAYVFAMLTCIYLNDAYHIEH